MKLFNPIATILLATLVVGGCKSTTTKTTSQPKSANATDPFDEKTRPLTANTHFAAGQVAESQKDPARAIINYQQAIQIDRSFAPAWFRLGMIYTENKETDNAVIAWNGYIEATKGSAAGYSDLGYTLDLAGRFDQAEAAYRKGVAADGKYEPCRVNYGLMLARQGRVDDATRQLTAVLTEAEAHYDLASIFESQGKKDAAKAEYRHALQCDPKLNDARTRLAGMDYTH
jgi:tetratricopeptide (TPR) repeat protein